eukprot:6316520-Pyramimonas_sp.AAC.1
MSCGMLAARSACAISSDVACRHRGRGLRSSRTRVSCESLQSARMEVSTSERVQSEDAGLPAAAPAIHGAARRGSAPDSRLARIPGRATQSPRPTPCARIPSRATQSPEPMSRAPALDDELVPGPPAGAGGRAASSAAPRSAPLGS